ncbi:hypothetical protein PybrP1_006715 [[Pythium] brassicae (nom. inval.)]|nr:hypothetical protein PybrP1_006715 [[Pythium] brassicae (nom. inval.)]
MPTINFGKHSGKDISTVFESEISYCKWLFQNESILRRNPEIKDFLESQMIDVDLGYTMNWGKHKGKTVDWVFEHDFPYFEWLDSSDFVSTKCKKLKSEIIRLRL